MNKSKKRALYGSHLPILTRVIELTHGDVLEVGMGLYSTPLLHTVCALQDRRLVSYDNDTEWFKDNKKWESPDHEVKLIEDWEQVDFSDGGRQHWSVAFVDEKPAKNRVKSIKKLARIANFVIIHDSEPESDKFFKYSWIYPLFKYRYDYKRCRPNTTVLSNFVDLSFLEK
jgi:hypothetical protein